MTMHGLGGLLPASVSAYDTAAQQTHGRAAVPFLFVVKRLTMRGFIVSDFFAGATRRSPNSGPGSRLDDSRSSRTSSRVRQPPDALIACWARQAEPRKQWYESREAPCRSTDDHDH